MDRLAFLAAASSPVVKSAMFWILQKKVRGE